LKKEDVKNGRGRYTHLPRGSKSATEEETRIEKSENIGILSNDKEGIAFVDPQDEIVLSVSQPQDVKDRQAQSQGRRLDAAALQAFKDRCYETSGLSSNAYVDCDNGDVNGDSFTTCAEGCGGKCCSGRGACSGFTGKGKQRVFHFHIIFGDLVLLFMNHILDSLTTFLLLVCKDNSCSRGSSSSSTFACSFATIPYVVGPSCTRGNSCRGARIGSADLSCTSSGSCFDARLSGVDLINSCNAEDSCQNVNANLEIAELIDCCNEEDQCEDLVGDDIVNAGCVSHMCFNACQEVIQLTSLI